MARGKGDVWSTITTAGKAVEITSEIGRIDSDNLLGEVEEVSAQGNWWAILAAAAKKRHRDAKHDLDVLEARLRKQARMEAQGRGEKFTVDSIRDEVTLNPQMIQAQQAVSKAEEDADVLVATQFALVRKAGLLEGMTGIAVEEIHARRAGGPASGASVPPGRVPRTPLRS